MGSCGINVSNYDVFLSFRGEDTRFSFTDHLYEALKREGINAFRDDEDINRGEELKPEIEKAIKESRGSIVVLSKYYATSTWCLDELMFILKQKREHNHFVLPIFYHVDPSDVRKQINTFALKVNDYPRWTDHNVDRWKASLTEIANLAGMVLTGSETKFMKEVVIRIYNKLDRKEVQVPPTLIGIETREKEIKSWLTQSDAEFLVICGMGGSGKTTLAKHILDSNWAKFENISIVEDIGSRCKESHDLLLLQQQLLGDIVGGKRRKIPGVCPVMMTIEEALQMKKALILLDDVVEPSQLETLLRTGNIHKQSKIIITTTEESTVTWLESRSWRCQTYKMKLLDDDESLELLNLHAFGSKLPMKGFEKLALDAVKYCEGNPLGLKVLGSSLNESNTISYWESQMNLLKKDINTKIQDVLIRSFLSLPYSSGRELFLHIACFFVGKDEDYVVKILEHDYCAISGIKTLTNRCLLSVTPNKKLMMHRLLQEMGKNIVRQESYKEAAKRSRVWVSSDSYDILRKGKGSETIEGLTLDMKLLREEKFALKSSELKTDALKKMDKLKLLQLNFVKFTGSYENFSEYLRWICWFGFDLKTIPSDLFMRNLVAIDMSYSKLEIFEPPTDIESLKILNLKDSCHLLEVRNISRLPNIETLILWNCISLVHVCETIRGLRSLALLNMTGCENMSKSLWKHINPIQRLKSSIFGERCSQQTSFTLPSSLERVFLKDCNLLCTDYFPLSFSEQSFLKYLNLGNGLFEVLPNYSHLKNLRVLDLSLCSNLKWLVCLPSTLVELYLYYCESLERVTFELHRFTLQEFGYEGCCSLSEVEGFVKLVPLSKLDEIDLGHMKWLKDYENHKVCLVGDDELTIGRNQCVQILYEFNIMSTSLPNMENFTMTHEYTAKSSFLSFDVPVPSCHKNKKLKGLNVSFKYTIQSDDWVWFAKITTSNGVDLMYNPKVFGKPEFGEIGLWLSYWPVGNMLSLDVGDKVNVSIIPMMDGFEVHECGASLVYTEDELVNETSENNMGVLVEDLSGFQLSTGAYYFCRRDFFELMEVGRLTPGWFRILVGDTIDYAEVRGWRKTGQPHPANPSTTELKTVKCIIHGPGSEEIYKIKDRVTSSLLDKTMDPLVLEKTLKSTGAFEVADKSQFGMSHQQALAHVTAKAAFSQSFFNYGEEPQMVNVVIAAKSEVGDSQIGSMDELSIFQSDITEPQQVMLEPVDTNDGYNWRKYGKKEVKGSPYPRSYYKCAHAKCPVNKRVLRALDGHISDIVYKGQHNHEPPQLNKRAGKGADDPEDEPNPKRRNTEMGPVSVPAPVPVESISAHNINTQYRTGFSNIFQISEEPEFVFQTKSDVDLLDDGFTWRKYGQKGVKGSPFPRIYFKCLFAKCNVRKHTERSAADPEFVVTTYKGTHNHDIAVPRHQGYNNNIGDGGTASKRKETKLGNNERPVLFQTEEEERLSGAVIVNGGNEIDVF